MRVKLNIPHDAPDFANQMVRQIEDAFELVDESAGAGPFTYKSVIIDRMTDAQIGTFETELEQSTGRMRQRWYAIQAVYHRAPDFAEFYALFVDAFGASEAARILAKSGG